MGGELRQCRRCTRWCPRFGGRRFGRRGRLLRSVDFSGANNGTRLWVVRQFEARLFSSMYHVHAPTPSMIAIPAPRTHQRVVSSKATDASMTTMARIRAAPATRRSVGVEGRSALSFMQAVKGNRPSRYSPIMPKRSGKRPRELNSLAASLVDDATDEPAPVASARTRERERPRRRGAWDDEEERRAERLERPSSRPSNARCRPTTRGN